MMLHKAEIENLVEKDNLDYKTVANAIGHNNTKKVSAILEILKIDLQSVADSKMILQLCEKLIESQSTALTEIKI